MLRWLLVMSILKVNALQRDTPLVVKMDPDQVVETFKSIISSPYFRDMANQIATKAVEHYISEAHKTDTPSNNREVGRQRPKPVDQNFSPPPQEKKGSIKIANVKITKTQQKASPTGMSIPASNQIAPISNSDIDQQLENALPDPERESPADTKVKDEEPKSLLSEQVAYALLKDPSPDGDLGLGLDSLEQPTSPKAPPPPKKINGMYFKRRRVLRNK